MQKKKLIVFMMRFVFVNYKLDDLLSTAQHHYFTSIYRNTDLYVYTLYVMDIVFLTAH